MTSLKARERVALLVEPGSFEETMASSRSQLIFGSGVVAGEQVYLIATDDGPPHADPAPPDVRLADHPNAKMIAGEARRVQEFLNLVHAKPKPLVYLMAAIMFPVQTRVPTINLDPGFHPVFPFGGHIKKLARLDVPKVAAAFANVFGAMTLALAQYDACVVVRDANIAMFHPAAAAAVIGVEGDPSYAAADNLLAVGAVDAVADSDPEAIAWVSRFLVALRPAAKWTPGAQRYSDVFSPSSLLSFHTRKVIDELVDVDSFVELRSGFARELITGIAHLAGRPIGIIANNSKVLAGAVVADSCRKIAHAASLFDRYGLPIVFLVDSNGLVVGEPTERCGLFRFAGDAMRTVARATVPKVTVVLRRGFTGGLHTMAGRQIGDRLIALEGATLGALPRSLIERNLKRPDLGEHDRRLLQDQIDDADLERMLAHGYVDTVVRDGDLRTAVARAIDEIAASPVNEDGATQGMPRASGAPSAEG